MDLPSKNNFSLLVGEELNKKEPFSSSRNFLVSMIRILMEVMLLTGNGRSGLLLMFYNLAKPRALVLLPTHLYLHHIM